MEIINLKDLKNIAGGLIVESMGSYYCVAEDCDGGIFGYPFPDLSSAKAFSEE